MLKRVVMVSVLALVTTAAAMGAAENVMVDVHIEGQRGQPQNGAYERLRENVYVRRLGERVFFTLSRQGTASDEEVPGRVNGAWQLEGFQCDDLSESAMATDAGACRSVFHQADLVSRLEKHQQQSQAVVRVFVHPQQHAQHRVRQLQFDSGSQPPPLFTDGTPVYYNCAYDMNNQWCCSEYNAAAGGPGCWNIDTCSEGYMAWSGQNDICCGADFSNCVLTYEPAMPVTTDAPTTAPPTSQPPTTAPPTTAPPTTVPPVTAPPTTQPPVPTLAATQAPTPPPTTTSVPLFSILPSTSGPTTAPPLVIVFPTPVTPAPTQAPTTTQPPATNPPTTQPPPIDPPTTQPPMTAAPTTQPPVTVAPTTKPPVTDPPVTQPPVTDPPATQPPATDPPATQPPATDPPVTQPPVTGPPSTQPPVTVPPVTEPPVTDPPATLPPMTDPPATTLPPVTDPPTTPPPLTTARTTQPPTTDPPITPSSVTEPPATQSPLTDPPTAQPPVADSPVTQPPATDLPTTQSVVTNSPVTQPPESPVTESPTSQPPVTDSPTTQPPATSPPAPVTNPPVTQSPVTDAPTTQPPMTEAPVTTSPITLPPVADPPSTQPPATEAPSTQPPLTNPPSTQPRLTDSPSTIQPPVTDPPSTQPPVTDAPATAQPPTTQPPAQPPVTSTPTGAPTVQPPISTTVSPTTSTPTTTVPVTISSPPMPTTTTTPTTNAPTEAPTASPPVPTTTSVPITTSSTPQPTTDRLTPVPVTTIPTATSPATSTPLSTTVVPSASPTAPSTAPTTTTSQPSSVPVETLLPVASTPPATSLPPATAGPTTLPTDAPNPSASRLPPVTTGASPTTAPAPSETVPASTNPVPTASPPTVTPTPTAKDPLPLTVTNQLQPTSSRVMTEMPPLPTDSAAPGTVAPQDPATDAPMETTFAPPATTLMPTKTPGDVASEFVSRSAGEMQATATSSPASTNGTDNSTDAFHQTLADFTEATRGLGERIADSANMLVASAVAANIVTIAITTVSSGVATVSGAATTMMTGGIAATQGLLIPGVVGGGGALGHATMPVADAGALFMLLSYLQFIASGSHVTLPGAPDFFYQFTDSLGWCVLQPTSPVRSGQNDPGKTGLSSDDMSRFSAADGDIIAGVLAYAQRIHVKPDELFTKTIIAFASVVGCVAAVVAILYTLVRCVARKRLEMVIQRLKDLPRAKLLMRLLTQSCLSICLMSEYALSMTSAFQMRYYHQSEGGYGAFASATAALIVVCFGLIVLGVVKLWKKTEQQLADPDFKFAWGSYYKYYQFRHRYFFVAKMGAEILSGVIIGLVSDVPSQLTLLMGLQLAMFLYTIESSPYTMPFQTVCSSTAFVMKMITYALISCFLTKATDAAMRNFVATLVIVLQVTLLLLFNSRQLHILYKQMRYLMALRRMRMMQDKHGGADGLTLEMENAATSRTSMRLRASSAFTSTPNYDHTRVSFGCLQSKRNSMVNKAPPLPLPLPVAAG